ncbi:aconitase 2 [Actinidia rufa]|uniref:Aconitase 2 n=1 Tax=Actinidia rufa TaxID=165716 RepID=A0A7J0HFW1_9ERIC|nr:aconitase 2 [Actinidia rufa]
MKTLRRKVKRGFLLFPNSLVDLHHWLPVGDAVDVDFDKELIRTRKDGKSVYFKDIRSSNEEVAKVDIDFDKELRFIVSRHRLFISVHWTYPSACHHNVLLEKSNSSVARNVTSTDGLASLEPSESKPTKTPLSISTPKPSVRDTGSESAPTVRHPANSTSMETTTSVEFSTLSLESRPSLPSVTSSLTLDDHCGDQKVIEHSVDKQLDGIHTTLFDVPSSDDDSRNDENKDVREDISTILDHSPKFRHPTHLGTPSEILMAALSSETSHAIEQKSDGDPNIQDVVVTKDVHNVKVEVKVVGETGFSQKKKIVSQGEPKNLIPETKERVFCSEASDLGTEMTRECSEMMLHQLCLQQFYNQWHQPQKGNKQKGKNTKVSGLASPSPSAFNSTDSSSEPSSTIPSVKATYSQILTMQEMLNQVNMTCAYNSSTTSASPQKEKKQKGKNTKVSGLASPSPSAFNSTDSSSEPSSTIPSVKAAYSQILTMQEMLNQLQLLKNQCLQLLQKLSREEFGDKAVNQLEKLVLLLLGRSKHNFKLLESKHFRAQSCTDLEHIEAPIDSFKKLFRLVSEHKYDEAFAAALQGSHISIVDIGFNKELIRTRKDGKSVYFKDIRPSNEEVAEVVESSVLPDVFKSTYVAITKGNPMWNCLSVSSSSVYAWDICQYPPCHEAIEWRSWPKDHSHPKSMEPPYLPPSIKGMELLSILSLSKIVIWTTANYKVLPHYFVSNMVAKVVIAKSFERIHNGNLIGMLISPLCFKPGQDADMLALTDHEHYTIDLPSQVSEMKPGQVSTDTDKLAKAPQTLWFMVEYCQVSLKWGVINEPHL